MRAILTILLMFVFAYLQVGYYFHSLSKRAEAKSEFKEKMASTLCEDAYTRFSWDSIKAAVQWEEEGEEFWLDGQLYDVVSKQIINGKTLLVCLNDTKEEEIVNRQLKLTLNNTHNLPNKSSHSIQFNFPDFILTESTSCQTSGTTASNKLSLYVISLHTHIADPDFPPPQAV
jgi:hypothetical protein